MPPPELRHLPRVPELLHAALDLAGAGRARVSVWRAAEPERVLAEALPPAWRTGLPRHPDRRRETLAARRCLLALVPGAADTRVVREPTGRPRLEGRPDLHFSLTHSHGHAAALVAERPCGVDLQRRVEKITRLRGKFERDDERRGVEAADDPTGALHVLWGAKESLFKLWSRRVIDWHEHLVVDAFDYRAAGGGLRGEVRKTAPALRAAGFYRWVGADDALCLVGLAQADY